MSLKQDWLACPKAVILVPLYTAFQNDLGDSIDNKL